MPTIRDLVDAFFVSAVSGGDPREPAKVVVRGMLDQLFPGKTVGEIYIDSLRKAIAEEPKTQQLEIATEDLRKVLKYQIDLEGLDLHTLSEKQFF